MKDAPAARRVNRADRGAFVSLLPALARRVGFVESRAPIARSDKQSARRSPQPGILHKHLAVTRHALFADVQQSAARASRRTVPPDHLPAAPGLLSPESLPPHAFAIGPTCVPALFRPDLGAIAIPLNIARVIFDAGVAEKSDELWLQRRVEMHCNGFPIAAVTEINVEEAAGVVRITSPVLNADAA